MVDAQQLSLKSGLLATFTPMSELRDGMVPRLPKQNRQIEEEPRQLPIRSSGKRACGHPRVCRNFPGARSASFQDNRSYLPLARDDTFPGR